MDDSRVRLEVYAAAALAVIITVIPFIYGLNTPFHFDDEKNIVERVALRQGAINAVKTSPYRAVTYLSYAIDWKLGNGNPKPFHITNLIIHLLCVFLIFKLLLSLIGATGKRGSIIGATAGAIFFGAHPIMVSNVTYISGRAGMLAALFSICSILAYLKRPSKPFYTMALIFFVLALFSKEDAASLPIVLFFLEISRSGDRNWKRVLPFFIFAVAYAIARLFFHEIVLGEGGGISEAQRLALLPYCWFKYLSMILWPVGLTIDHHVPLLKALSDPRMIFIPIFIALALLTWLIWRHERLPALPILWFMAALLPSSVMPLADMLAENRMYFALAGISLGYSVLIAYLISRPGFGKATAHICALIIAVAFVILSIRQVSVWQSDTRLWSQAARLAPDYTRPLDNLAQADFDRGDLRGAGFYARRSLSLDGNNAVAWNNMGLALSLELNSEGVPALKQNGAGIAAAENAYRKALALKPVFPEAHRNFALFLIVTGRGSTREILMHLIYSYKQNPYQPDVMSLRSYIETYKKKMDEENNGERP